MTDSTSAKATMAVVSRPMGQSATAEHDTSVEPFVGANSSLTPTDVARPVAKRSIRIGGTAYPLFLPSIRDPRLHVASVTISVHVLGQLGLDFRLSIPQILAAVLTTAIIDVVTTFRSRRAFVWPASAMLTGSGIALILRVPGTPDSHWSTHQWYVFSGVAAFAMLTKHAIRYRGSHLFNPSNVALVVTFLVLGSTRAEPLDFWWAPMNPWMVTAYAVIIGGGLLITRRLRLLAMAATFWMSLTVGIGILAASGHCITARWSFTPVCGFEFWRIIITSPEIMIFLFFMITDPKTVPAGRVGRVMFGLLVAVISVLLMAPQDTEFGSKVALLAGLVLVCGLRPILDRLVPEPGSEDDRLRTFVARLLTGGSSPVGLARRVARMGLVVGALASFGVGVVAAGASARGVLGGDTDEILGRVPHDIDPSTFPTISVDQGVLDWDHAISGEGAQQIVLTLAENLELETQALLRDDEEILTAVDHGDRLDDMRARLREATDSGVTVVHRYVIEDVHVTLLVPFGRQDGLSLGLETSGTVTEERYGADGSLMDSDSREFSTTFVMRRATGDRWLNVDELPPGTED
jgi:Na+-translocating ferredoxin:NAD+ oxidoreductase RnfD subunit